MLGRAVEWNYLAVNPAANLRRPRDERQASDNMHALDATEVRALIEAAGAITDESLSPAERQRRAQFARALVMTAAMTGMRRGELVGVTWGDVDWRRNRLHVRRSVGLGGRITKPKSAKSVRAIALTPTLVAELKRHRLAARWSDEDDLLFSSSHRTTLDGRNMVREVFDPAVRRAKLPKMRFHDLRHTFASLLIAQGAHPKYISEQLGHASVQITMDRYSHLFDQSYSDESDKLEAALFGASDTTATGLGGTLQVQSAQRRSKPGS
jgi:integrase